jgi:hypothetical protein
MTGRLPVESSWAVTTDRSRRTAPARAAFDERLRRDHDALLRAKSIDPEGIDPKTRAQMFGHYRKAYFHRLSCRVCKSPTRPIRDPRGAPRDHDHPMVRGISTRTEKWPPDATPEDHPNTQQAATAADPASVAQGARSPLERFLEALEAMGLRVRSGWNGNYEAQCPAHDDRIHPCPSRRSRTAARSWSTATRAAPRRP